MTRGPYVGRGIVGIAAIIGLSVLIAESAATRAPSASPHATRIGHAAFMSRVDQRNTSDAFRGGEVAAVMGRVDLDLRGAAMAGDEAVLEVDVVMGRVGLRIPDDWTVVSEMVEAFGAADIRAARPEGPPAPRLVLRGAVLMGRLDVRN